uniref:Regulatory protein RecX n=1 Tax=uncultured bacterium UPO53 TaxID=1776978 RepID=A0A126SYF4_9BACT|nr:alanyl-tRNA synthetase [uncultured bacterium UPO53]
MKRVSEGRLAVARSVDGEEAAMCSSAFLRGRALALLARREHSRAELHRKLSELGGTGEALGTVLDDLVRERLQSDERFAESFVRSRVVRGQGPQAIATELRARGIDKELLEAALTHGPYDWYAQAAEVRHKRFGPVLPEDARERARQARFLQYRGFTAAQVSHALRCKNLEPD